MSDSKQSRKPTRISFIAADKAAKRVIAPYVKIVRRGLKVAVEPKSKEFASYLGKKPSVLLRDLTSFLSDTVDLTSLLHESSDVLKLTTKSAGVSLYIVDSATNEIYQSQKHFDIPEPRVRWKVEEGTIVAAFVACQKEFVMIDDVLEDERFPLGIGSQDQLIKSVLCVPVVTPDGDCFAVIELFRDTDMPAFTRDELKIVIVVSGWMGAAIHQNQQRLGMLKQQELNDYLLELTKCYFEESVATEIMITEVVKFAKTTLGAERGSFFIIDQESEDMLADVYDEGLQESDPSLHKKNIKLKLGKDRNVASLVAKTGVTINVKDAFNDPRFAREVDAKTGFITRSILSMPIMGRSGIMGVIQVVNKKSGCFSKGDEVLFKTFSAYCALTLHYTALNSQKKKLGLLNEVYLGLVDRQLPPCPHDQKYFTSHPKSIPSGFTEFKWYVPEELLGDMPHLIFHLFKEMDAEGDLIHENATLFILTCRKLYRNNPYHNFEHAFAVCHCMYNILWRNQVYFSSLELRALLVAALCHDIDHGGCTNNFLMLSNDTLFQLYEESTWENHHYHITVKLLQLFPLYKRMPPNDYKIFLKEIKDAILATDLAQYFKNRLRLLPIVNEDVFDFSNPNHKQLLKFIAMTVCDLSGQCKPYEIAKKITENIYAEFYAQGDVEKSMSLSPLSMMDREKNQQIPEDQINFLSVIVLPATDLLRNVLTNTNDLHEECLHLRKTWMEIIELRGRKSWKQDDSLVDKEKKP